MILENWPQEKYDIIYADPPWQWDTFSDKGQKKSPQKHYSLMTLDDIQALPISTIAKEDSLLFLWVTGPLLLRQLQIMEAWGFTYKTIGFTWGKLNKVNGEPFMGTGYYTRQGSEFVAIGRRGTPPRPANRSVKQFRPERIREHSRKPDTIRQDILSMYPETKRIELFARTQTPGWDVWGNQTEKFTNLYS